MATNYLKPQEPLHKLNKETGDINYIYPITTADQVILDDDTRLGAKLDIYATKTEVPEVIEDYLSDLGALTVDLEGSTEGTVAGIDADTFQGYTIDKFVMYNINGEDGDIDTTIDADTLGGIPASEYATKAYVEELLGGIENGSY